MPRGVSREALTSPIFKSATAVSKSAGSRPRGIQPTAPPAFADGASEYWRARSAKLAPSRNNRCNSSARRRRFSKLLARSRRNTISDRRSRGSLRAASSSATASSISVSVIWTKRRYFRATARDQRISARNRRVKVAGSTFWSAIFRRKSSTESWLFWAMVCQALVRSVGETFMARRLASWSLISSSISSVKARWAMRRWPRADVAAWLSRRIRPRRAVTSRIDINCSFTIAAIPPSGRSAALVLPATGRLAKAQIANPPAQRRARASTT